jgi:exonuclease SbcD
MRILHTSDWHLGQSFFNKSRKDEHLLLINWLSEQVASHKISAVIIAGDIFDTGTPPSYAREMYNNLLVSLQQQDCQLIVIAGNHDSVAMLNESKSLFKQLGSQVVTAPSDDLTTQVISLTNQQGEDAALLCAVPFLRARDIQLSGANESSEQKQKNLSTAIREHYQALYTHAQNIRGERKLPILATGHLTAVGVSQTESVRDIYIGTLSGFDANLFPDFDYLALGHIHRPQWVGKQNKIRYSGSPIPLSFDEVNQQKTMTLLNLENAQISVTELAIPVFQHLQQLNGSLVEIKQALAALDPTINYWLAIEVAEQDYLSDLREQIIQLTEGYNVEVLQLKRKRSTANGTLQQHESETLQELTPKEVFDKRLETEVFAADQAELKARLEQKFEQLVAEIKVGAQ